MFDSDLISDGKVREISAAPVRCHFTSQSREAAPACDHICNMIVILYTHIFPYHYSTLLSPRLSPWFTCDGMEAAGTARGRRRLLSVRVRQGRRTSTVAMLRRPAHASTGRHNDLRPRPAARGAHGVEGSTPSPGSEGPARCIVSATTNNSNSQSLLQLELAAGHFARRLDAASLEARDLAEN